MNRWKFAVWKLVPAAVLVPLASLGALAACWPGIGGVNVGTGGSAANQVWNCTCTYCDDGSPSIAPNCFSTEAAAQSFCQDYCGPSGEANVYCGADHPGGVGACCGLPAVGMNPMMVCPLGIQGELSHWGDGQSTDATLDSTRSTATMTYYGHSTAVSVGGSVELTSGCSGGQCSISFNQISLSPSNFTVTDNNGVTTTLTNVTVMNVGNVAGTRTIDGQITIQPQDILLNVSGQVNGVLQAVQFRPGQAVTGIYDPSAGRLTLSGNLLPGTGFGLQFSLANATMSRPPVANAGPAQSIVIPSTTSSVTVTLDGTGSSDLDGNLDHVDWYEGSTHLGRGFTLNYTFPLGVHTVTAVARDTTAKWNAATTTVSVLEGPVYGGPQLMWQNPTSGVLGPWVLNGTTVVSQSAAPLTQQCGNVSPDYCSQNWTVVDAKANTVLWWNKQTGHLRTWEFDTNGNVTVDNDLTNTAGGYMTCGNADGCINGSHNWRPIGRVVFALPSHQYQTGLLWHDTIGGSVMVWEIGGAANGSINASAIGTTVTSTYTLTSNVCGTAGNCSTQWTAMATADFNGDGASDLAWLNTNGTVEVWLLNTAPSTVVKGFQTLSATCGGTCAQDWRLVGAADFNGDGFADLLWYNWKDGYPGVTGGTLRNWLLNGSGSVTSTPDLSQVCDTASGCSSGTPLGYVWYPTH